MKVPLIGGKLESLMAELVTDGMDKEQVPAPPGWRGEG